MSGDTIQSTYTTSGKDCLPGMKRKMSKLLKLAHKFNCFYLSGLCKGECRPFFVSGFQVGLVRPDIMKHLLRFPDVFHIDSTGVKLNPAFRDYADRTKKIEEVLQVLRYDNALSTLKGWRDEDYNVRVNYCADALLRMDRSATCLFGICNYGVDINGYVNDPEKGLCIWLQQRSLTKQRWAGKWDNMVGGGLSCDHDIMETAFKEADEEASITEDLMVNLKAGGSVSFYFENEKGLFPNTEFVFDLELPPNFVPKNKDGEVEKFELLTAKEALDRAYSVEFKTTSCPVLIDFLVRHNFIRPDTEPCYPEVVELLHVPLQTLYNNRYNSVNRQTNGSDFDSA